MAVDRVDDGTGAGGRVDHGLQVTRLVAARAPADEEAVRHQEADLATRQLGDAANHVGERRQRRGREARGLGQDGLGLALCLALGGPLLGLVRHAGGTGRRALTGSLDGRTRPAVEDAARLGDQRARRQPQRRAVAAQQHLGLRRRDLGATRRADEGLAADEPVDRGGQHRAVGRELPDAGCRARRHQRDAVVGEQLGDEPRQRLLGVLQVARGDVQVVEDDHDVAARDSRQAWAQRSSARELPATGAAAPAGGAPTNGSAWRAGACRPPAARTRSQRDRGRADRARR